MSIMTGGAPIVVIIEYTNHRNERRHRTIIPMAIRFGKSEWHTHFQWLLEAIDVEKMEIRIFAMKDIHSWKPFEDNGNGSEEEAEH